MSEHARTAPNFDRVRDAAATIEGTAHRTPILTCSTLDRLAGKRLFLKCENLQKGGSFKFRGALYSVRSLSDEEAAKGVATHSSGNHAQALALAARLRRIPARIVMPTSASAIKRRAVLGYGGQVIDCAPNLASREETAQKVLEETGATFVHPYDSPITISGQGTIGLELIEDLPDLDAIVAPVGGGGLLSGICVAVTSLKPEIRIFAGEPEGADDAARSMAKGQRVPQTAPDTIADGLLTSLGEWTWPIIQKHVEAVVTVSDEEIIRAMRLCWERAKIIVEPSGAVPLAAVLSDRFRALQGIERVAVVLSGGNIDLDALPWCSPSKI